MDKGSVTDVKVDTHAGFALEPTEVEKEIAEGYAVIVQETYLELSEGREGLTMPDYETYRESYLQAILDEAQGAC